MSSAVVKQGPFVFLKDVLIMEILAFAVFFAASFLANYEALYQAWNLNQHLRYNIFILIVSSLFQLVYLTALFINWYFSYFEIGEREITRRSGIFFRRRKSINLSDVISIETYQSPFDRWTRHATIVIEHRDGRVTKIRNVSDFDNYLKSIKRVVQNLSNHKPIVSIEALLEQGENAGLEFKATLRYDIRRNEVSKEIERAVMKSIVGLLNADGGIILVGVNDTGAVCGLKNDYQGLPRKNRDGFENHLTALVRTMIGLPFAKYVRAHFEKVKDEDVCLIQVQNGHKPAYLKTVDGKEEFFVRVGNSTQPFSMSDTADYIKTHFS